MAASPEEWRDNGDGSTWVIGTKLVDRDVDRLQHVRYLTLVDTRLPADFLGQLPKLELLDLRGALSARTASQLAEVPNLRALAINRARTLTELPALGSSLEFLDLYGLSQLTTLPPMQSLTNLRRVNLGQLRTLTNWTPLATLPRLEALELTNHLTPDLDVLTQLATQSTFTHFGWSAPDEPHRKLAAATQTANRPKPNNLRIQDLWNAY
ncbi:hypothetical protein [Kribbella sp. NPDC006257]|uniref:hypothetical protein n=1 Tax=Kribbella sp. NPDC006257 TaxID=3156738 RepID=UPI0033B4908F